MGGRNVDLVMEQPYSVPIPTGSTDVVISGQVFEHIPFMWASFMELARILRPGGLIFITVPSRGHRHDVYDCWRIYPDGMRALAAVAKLDLLEARTDFPPTDENRRFVYAQIDQEDAYWGDTVGVFRKPVDYPSREVWAFRTVAVWWANRVRDLSGEPSTPILDAYRQSVAEAAQRAGARARGVAARMGAGKIYWPVRRTTSVASARARIGTT